METKNNKLWIDKFTNKTRKQVMATLNNRFEFEEKRSTNDDNNLIVSFFEYSKTFNGSLLAKKFYDNNNNEYKAEIYYRDSSNSLKLINEMMQIGNYSPIIKYYDKNGNKILANTNLDQPEKNNLSTEEDKPKNNKPDNDNKNLNVQSTYLINSDATQQSTMNKPDPETLKANNFKNNEHDTEIINIPKNNDKKKSQSQVNNPIFLRSITQGFALGTYAAALITYIPEAIAKSFFALVNFTTYYISLKYLYPAKEQLWKLEPKDFLPRNTTQAISKICFGRNNNIENANWVAFAFGLISFFVFHAINFAFRATTFLLACVLGAVGLVIGVFVGAIAKLGQLIITGIKLNSKYNAAKRFKEHTAETFNWKNILIYFKDKLFFASFFTTSAVDKESIYKKTTLESDCSLNKEYRISKIEKIVYINGNIPTVFGQPNLFLPNGGVKPKEIKNKEQSKASLKQRI